VRPFLPILRTSTNTHAVVLGRPGAGCTTLLKTLANQHESYHAVDGFMHYTAGIAPYDLGHKLRGDVVYCEEDDVHFPTLSVDETLRFAARTKMPAASGRPARPTTAIGRTISNTLSMGNRKGKGKDVEKGGDEIEPISKREFTEELVGTLSTVFGLRHVRKTKVGDAAIRGVSGGERKRVSIAEALATRARLGCWDKCVHLLLFLSPLL
jgi:ATP-binding cassette, subfamily G (WHITE), member 2, SNQ2